MPVEAKTRRPLRLRQDEATESEFERCLPRDEDHFVGSAAVLGFVLEVKHAEPGVVFWQGANELVEVLKTERNSKTTSNSRGLQT